MLCAGNAGSGLPLPRLCPLFGVELCLDFRVRHSNKSPHEVRELAKVTCRILRGTLRVTRHICVSSGRAFSILAREDTRLCTGHPARSAALLGALE